MDVVLLKKLIDFGCSLINWPFNVFFSIRCCRIDDLDAYVINNYYDRGN